jgi:hypothetical protein
MYYAYTEILSGLIRIGPDAHLGWPEGPDPYELTVTFSADKGVATLKGLVTPRKYSFKESREIMNAVQKACQDLHLEPIWERIKHKETDDADCP